MRAKETLCFDEMCCKNVFVSILPGWMSVITFSRGDRNILKYSVILVYFLSAHSQS